MAVEEISAASLIYVKARIGSPQVNGVPVDPTGDAVALAFMRSGSPASGDWKTGSWQTDTSTTPSTYWARCWVGPGGTVQLAAGNYTVHVKITDSPEIPVIKSGPLRVY